ncbi:MAG: hypothetical protein ABIZ95_13910 [Pyrinomonadaceae bacterium]
MFILKRAMFIGIMSVILVAVADASAMPSSSELKNKRITITMRNKLLYDVFKRLIDDYDIAIGFEQSNLDDGKDHYVFETNIRYDEGPHFTPDGRPVLFVGNRPSVNDHFITIDYRNARLEEVMDDIVAQMKNYSWRVDNEVINIYPLKGREPKFARLMGRKIDKFFAPKDMEVGYLEALIVLELPEFKTFILENNLYVESWQNATPYLKRPLPEAMTFSDLTFKDLLNRITKSKRGGWILKRGTPKIYESPTGEKKEFIELEI